jgi:large subunit ribosomal protein L7/L12
VANVDFAKIVDELSKLTVVELAELKKMLEDKWGVKAAAAVAAAPVAAAAAPVAASESTEFKVTLDEAPADKKIGVIKVVREVTGLGLKEAKDLVDKAPQVIKATCPKTEAEEIVGKVNAAGGKASSKGL